MGKRENLEIPMHKAELAGLMTAATLAFASTAGVAMSMPSDTAPLPPQPSAMVAIKKAPPPPQPSTSTAVVVDDPTVVAPPPPPAAPPEASPVEVATKKKGRGWKTTA